MLANSRETYGLIAQLLHWATVVLIFILLPLGLYMHELPVSSAEEAAYKSWLYSLHKTLGVTVFLVAIVRVAWSAIQPHPKPLNSDRKLESLAAQTIHWMLYGAIILMPLTGWLHHSAAEGFAPIWWSLPQDLPMVPKNPQLASFFGLAHFFTVILLGLALVLHIGGALKHVFVDHDSTLARMIPGRVPAIPADLPDPHFKNLPVLLAILTFLVLGGATAVGYNISGPIAGQNPVNFNPAENVAAGWLVDQDKSRLDIQIIQSGSPVSGSFANWNAAIIFDAENLESSKVEVEVDIVSLVLGNVSEQATSPDFLNAAHHPVATFVSSSFVNTGSDNYEVRGELTLAGLSNPITLPFLLKIENDRAFVQGEVTIERLDFDIGKKGFPTDGMVGYGVVVTVNLEAEKTPSS
ncbi:MAG: cytochrome [Hyphomicrobiales bacterium]|nr:cytochrome [Hyphomicrobiales bacterium]MCP4997539.1 cytochrome [Hyphomicrobiales bacterium]